MRRLLASVLVLLAASCGSRSALDGGTRGHVVAIASGTSVACALLDGDEIRCWDTADAAARPLPGVWDAVDLAVGGGDLVGGEVCAVLRSGRVRCADRASGAAYDVPGVEDATHISMGWGFACVLLASSRVSCWGDNGHGALGDGTLALRRTAEEVPGVSDVVEVSAGDFSACALGDDGRVSCWGRDYGGQLGDGLVHGMCGPEPCSPVAVEVAGLSDAIAISAGLNYTCALHRDRSVSCWGWNYVGQLGVGSAGDRSTLTPVALAGEAELVLSGYTRGCLVLRAGRRVVCAGHDPSSGGSDPRTSLVPLPVPDLDGAVDLAGGWTHTCALMADGGVVCTSEDGPIAIDLE